MPTRAGSSDADAIARFGDRLRSARLGAGLTQSELAGQRYTKAFVSALEHGESRPSVPALDYFAGRLGVRAAELLGEPDTAWERLAADLSLAAGDWQAALDGYDALLAAGAPPARRAELLRGRAEALSRSGRHDEALPAAVEAAALFAAQDRPADAAAARYWQASAAYWSENAIEARSLLRDILAQVRTGLAVEPGFEHRVLIALAMIEGREGEPKRALVYLNEARARLGELDERRRASFLQSLAINYREAGDYEGALAMGRKALAFFELAASELDIAVLDNELALTYLAQGNLRRARRHADAAATRFKGLGDRTSLANVMDTQATIALAHDELDQAEAHTDEAISLARSSGNGKALISALLTAGRIARRRVHPDEARRAFDEALAQARAHGREARVRECLVELSDLAADQGDTAAAYALAREALG